MTLTADSIDLLSKFFLIAAKIVVGTVDWLVSRKISEVKTTDESWKHQNGDRNHDKEKTSNWQQPNHNSILDVHVSFDQSNLSHSFNIFRSYIWLCGRFILLC